MEEAAEGHLQCQCKRTVSEEHVPAVANHHRDTALLFMPRSARHKAMSWNLTIAGVAIVACRWHCLDQAYIVLPIAASH
jgi:hypothetical protein